MNYEKRSQSPTIKENQLTGICLLNFSEYGY